MKQQYDQILVTPKPFVKWAGGKRQLISVLNENLPKSFGSYFEPFLGGGALLFNMLIESKKQKCIISDLNSDLVLAYATIRDRVDDLISIMFEIAGKERKVNYLGEKNISNHYGNTPYRYTPKSAKKIVPLEFVDLGQGLLDIIEEINHEIKKSENSRL